jgi:hypothetical protein
MKDTPKPGDLCLVIGDLIDEGKVVTAVRPRSLGPATLWQIAPPVRCRLVPLGGGAEMMGTTDTLEQRYLMPIRPEPDPEEVETEEEAPA